MSDVQRTDKQTSQIVLRARGQWFHQGEPFENEKIIAFFHRAIRKDENGEYFLCNQVEGKTEHVYFEVEDTAYFVQAIQPDPDGAGLLAALNTEARVPLALDSLEIDPEGVVYCRVLDDDRARILPGALLELCDLAAFEESAPGVFTVSHQGVTHPIRQR